MERKHNSSTYIFSDFLISNVFIQRVPYNWDGSPMGPFAYEFLCVNFKQYAYMKSVMLNIVIYKLALYAILS